MNFTALKASVAGRGFQYLTDAQLGEDINRARGDLDEVCLWPYRQKDVTGLAPLTITDLEAGTIEAVTDTVTFLQLAPGDYRVLLDDYGDLSVTGDPVFFYVAWQAGVPLVATYPTSTSNEIGVVYYRTTPDLVAGTDVPAAPSRFHPLMVDLAVQYSYRRTDNFGAADGLQATVDAGVARMVGALMGGQQIAGAHEQGAVWESLD